jgi:hypothetical protein
MTMLPWRPAPIEQPALSVSFGRSGSLTLLPNAKGCPMIELGPSACRELCTEAVIP